MLIYLLICYNKIDVILIVFSLFQKYTAYYICCVKDNLQFSPCMADNILSSMGYRQTEFEDEVALGRVSGSIVRIALDLHMCELELERILNLVNHAVDSFGCTVKAALKALQNMPRRNPDTWIAADVIRLLGSAADPSARTAGARELEERKTRLARDLQYSSGSASRERPPVSYGLEELDARGGKNRLNAEGKPEFDRSDSDDWMYAKEDETSAIRLNILEQIQVRPTKYQTPNTQGPRFRDEDYRSVNDTQETVEDIVNKQPRASSAYNQDPALNSQFQQTENVSPPSTSIDNFHSSYLSGKSTTGYKPNVDVIYKPPMESFDIPHSFAPSIYSEQGIKAVSRIEEINAGTRIRDIGDIGSVSRSQDRVGLTRDQEMDSISRSQDFYENYQLLQRIKNADSDRIKLETTYSQQALSNPDVSSIQDKTMDYKFATKGLPDIYKTY